MSYANTYEAFQVPGITKGQQHVLAAICTFADKNGLCWPSVETIAARCKSSVRTVQEHIKVLVSKGLITRIYRTGKSAVTKVLLGRMPPATPAETAPTPPQILHPNLSSESVNTTTAGFETATTETPVAIADFVISEIEQPGQPTAPAIEKPLEENAIFCTNSVADFAGQPPADMPTAASTAATVASQDVDPANSPITESNPATDPDPLAEVPQSILEDIAAVRRAKKRSPKITKTEAQVLAEEAKKAGWTMQQVLITMILHGWSRFQADWVQHVPPLAAPAPQALKQEPVKAASPEVIAAFKARFAEMKARWAREVIGPMRQ